MTTATTRSWRLATMTPTLLVLVQTAFVAREDNHYESEADSTQGLLLMYLRTGQRGWFDLAEAWARYHLALSAAIDDGHATRAGTRPRSR